MIEHVNDLKLQFLVELSKHGDRCAAIEADLTDWLMSTIHATPTRRSRSSSCRTSSRPGKCGPCSGRSRRSCRCSTASAPGLPHDAAPARGAGAPGTARARDARPGFPATRADLPAGRFLHGYDLKFLEFNSDSPAGIGWCDVLFEGLRAASVCRGHGVFHTLYTPMLPALIETLLDAYAAMRARRPDLPERPRLAVVDVAGRRPCPSSASSRTPRRARARRRRRGPGRAELRRLAVLHVGGEPVQSSTAGPPPEGGRATLAAAARDGALLHRQPFRACREQQEDPRPAAGPALRVPAARGGVEPIRATLPWTRILRPGRATYGPWRFDLLTFVADNRERLVLKPADDYGGRGVILGN